MVKVSWYEAMAFCRWLSDRTDENITLPTEEQWQYAAQGDDDRAYPWGDEWDCTRCNAMVDPCVNEIRNKITPVTEYEGKGDSPFGVVDMVGNVMEWCMTTYPSQLNDIDSLENRALRGGVFHSTHPDSLRCDIQIANDAPYSWRFDCGFRIVRLST